jgi:hypothetical protein
VFGLPGKESGGVVEGMSFVGNAAKKALLALDQYWNSFENPELNEEDTWEVWERRRAELEKAIEVEGGVKSACRDGGGG